MLRPFAWIAAKWTPQQSTPPQTERVPLPTNILDDPEAFAGEIFGNPMIANTAPARSYVGFWSDALLVDLRDIWLSRSRRERNGDARDDALHMVAMLSESIGLTRFQIGRSAFDRNRFQMRHAISDLSRKGS